MEMHVNARIYFYNVSQINFLLVILTTLKYACKHALKLHSPILASQENSVIMDIFQGVKI